MYKWCAKCKIKPSVIKLKKDYSHANHAHHGGAGYIGSHTVGVLLQANYAVIILDNFCNSSPKVIKRIKTIKAQTTPKNSLTCIDDDVRDSGILDNIFSEYPVHGVIHFAGLKALG